MLKLRTNKIEVLSFKEFISPPATQIQKKSPLIPVYSFLPPISIKSLFPLFIDPTFTVFVLGSSLIALIAVSESILAKYGFTEIASFMTGTMKIVLPVVGFATLGYFLISL